MPTASPRPSPRPEPVRLQKLLADGGFGSRRACERLIAEGRVAVDGEVIREQGVQVDPAAARITVDGQPVGREPLLYLLLHKPIGYVCTSRDPSGRPTFHDLLPRLPARVYTAGRLDMDSEGLLLFTNDTRLGEMLTRPGTEVPKTYEVTVDPPVPATAMPALRAAQVLPGGARLRPADIVPIGGTGKRLRVTIREGKNRQIRRLFAAHGFVVTELRRVRIGPLLLGRLPAGKTRLLTGAEVDALRASSRGSADA